MKDPVAQHKLLILSKKTYRDATGRSAGQNVPHLSWNTLFYRVLSGLALVPSKHSLIQSTTFPRFNS